MSADNGIWIAEIDGAWWVWYGFASEELIRSRFRQEGTPFPSRNAALLAAHNLATEYSVLEYGVSEIELPAEEAEAYQAGLRQRLEDIELVKDGVCLACGIDGAGIYDEAHAAGVVEGLQKAHDLIGTLIRQIDYDVSLGTGMAAAQNEIAAALRARGGVGDE